MPDGWSHHDRPERPNDPHTFQAAAERAYPGLTYVSRGYMSSGLWLDVTMRTQTGATVQRRIYF